MYTSPNDWSVGLEGNSKSRSPEVLVKGGMFSSSASRKRHLQSKAEQSAQSTLPSNVTSSPLRLGPTGAKMNWMEYLKIWDYHARNLFLAPSTLAYKTYRSERYLLIRPTSVYVKPDERLWGGDLILLTVHFTLSYPMVVSCRRRGFQRWCLATSRTNHLGVTSLS